jgi:hypothetical protein
MSIQDIQGALGSVLRQNTSERSSRGTEDSEDVEGAIELTVSGVRIIDKDAWDDEGSQYERAQEPRSKLRMDRVRYQ